MASKKEVKVLVVNCATQKAPNQCNLKNVAQTLIEELQIVKNIKYSVKCFSSLNDLKECFELISVEALDNVRLIGLHVSSEEIVDQICAIEKTVYVDMYLFAAVPYKSEIQNMAKWLEKTTQEWIASMHPA